MCTAPTTPTTTTRTRLARHLAQQVRHVVHTVIPRTTPAQLFRRRRELRGLRDQMTELSGRWKEAFPIDGHGAWLGVPLVLSQRCGNCVGTDGPALGELGVQRLCHVIIECEARKEIVEAVRSKEQFD